MFEAHPRAFHAPEHSVRQPFGIDVLVMQDKSNGVLPDTALKRFRKYILRCLDEVIWATQHEEFFKVHSHHHRVLLEFSSLQLLTQVGSRTPKWYQFSMMGAKLKKPIGKRH